MSRKTHRAGAVATALMLIVTLFAVQGSGAAAQSEEFQPLPTTASAISADPSAAEPAPQDQILPRFVSEPVVQPLPEMKEPADAQHASLRELVAHIAGEEELSGDLKCLAQAIYFEARGEPLAGQLAVARVIVNRTQSPNFPDDYCSVVTQPAQFSFVRNGRIPAAPANSRAWQRAKAIARIAHQELWESEAKDALFFHANYVRPRWARTKLARATIDSHIFYR
jgi:spore germination cell wall hydrolase CwlJ-like protein